MTTIPMPAFREDLISLFTELVLVPGTSRQERNVADFIRAKLAGLPYDISEDGAGVAIGGNTGNLLITPKHFDSSRPARVFMAHMDTVRRTDGIKVVRHNGKITSDGSSQLGADNRAGVAVLLQMLLDAAQIQRDRAADETQEVPGNGQHEGIPNTRTSLAESPKDEASQVALADSMRNFMVIFTIAEEIGLVGAGQLDLSPFNVEGVFVFDSSRRPGAYIQECAGKYQFDIEIKGRAAHSAVAPSEGISAIMVAARGLSGIQTGQIDPMTTINIGFVEGGEAMNIVAPRCVVRGEVRSTTYEAIEGHLDDIEKVFAAAAAEAGATAVMTRHKDFAPYSLPGESLVVREMERVLAAVGLVATPLRYTGGSDANVLNDKGYNAVNIGIGAQKPHADDEFILEEDLMAAFQIALNLYS
jgi:tripeptide aminopeptidase